MTIEDQIRDEKLQYDINREAAKISALSSGKVDKYKHRTGEEILPSNQQQIVEQAIFTYSPLGKAFENQTETIEDQGEKQTNLIEDQGEKQIKTIEKYIYKADDDPIILKEKEIYNALVDKEKEKIEKLDCDINTSKLEFKFKGKTPYEDFSDYDNALALMDKTKFGLTSPSKVKKYQKEFKDRKAEINKVRRDHLLPESKTARKNIEKLYEVRQAIIDFYDGFTERAFEARHQSRQKGEGRKILSPKQMLQRLPIALAQIKAGNNSESLLSLSEIQIVYSLYQAKEITKKVYNNKINKSIIQKWTQSL